MNALAPTGQQKLARVRTLLEKAMPKIREVLPRHVDAGKLIRVTIAAVSRTPALLDCDPISICQGVMVASRLGLEPDGTLGSAYLVPFAKKAQLIVGYRGLVDLARRSGEVVKVDSAVVHKGDKFRYSLGDEPRIEHEPELDAEKAGLPVAVYAVATYKTGEKQREVMTWAQVEAIRARSRASGSGPWVTDTEEMARKTVIRRLCKHLPMSVELAAGLKLQAAAESGDDGVVAAVAEDLDLVVSDDEAGDVAPTPTSAGDALAAELRAKRDVKPAKFVKVAAIVGGKEVQGELLPPANKEASKAPAAPTGAPSATTPAAANPPTVPPEAPAGAEPAPSPAESELEQAARTIGLHGKSLACLVPPTRKPDDPAPAGPVQRLTSIAASKGMPSSLIWGWVGAGPAGPTCGQAIKAIRILAGVEGKPSEQAPPPSDADAQPPAPDAAPEMLHAELVEELISAAKSLGPNALDVASRLAAMETGAPIAPNDRRELEGIAEEVPAVMGQNGVLGLWKAAGRDLATPPTAEQAARFVISVAERSAARK